MRLPKIRQLTEEQKNVYLYAPIDTHVLVNGPPGTGKTLIACLRAKELKDTNFPVVLGMFNRVLVKYSSNVDGNNWMPSKTVHTWFRDWWHISGLPPYKSSTAKIFIQAGYHDKEKVKAAGGRWKPDEWRQWEQKKGVWMVDNDVYFSDPEAFSPWRLWHSPPVIENNPGSFDWAAITTHVFEHEEFIDNEALDLGCFLIDEGQDFSPQFYKFLRIIAAVGKARGEKVRNPLRCFVLADENQQITQENSTLQDIAENLGIKDENRYLLLDNFRNSREIAELARQFFADVGALPKLPERRSEKPVFMRVKDHEQTARQIMIWIMNNPGKEAGILVFTEDTRTRIVDLLRDKIRQLVGRTITLQTYSWKSRRQNRPENLLFDVPDTVTVLNMQSCKGLEFDAVFIVKPYEAQIGLYGPDQFQMQMFVATSRAREWVCILDSGKEIASRNYYSLLPGEEFLDRSDPLTIQSSVFSSPEKAYVSETPMTAPPESNEIFQELEGLNIKVEDHRHKNGALWVYGNGNLEDKLTRLGFRYSTKRRAWWKQ